MKLKLSVKIVGWLLVAMLSQTGWSAAASNDKGARTGEHCARECLEGIARKYFDALVQRNPSAAPLADHVAFSENNVALLLGDGLWGTITGRGPPSTELYFADPQAGQVGFFGIVDEHGVPGYLAVRLRVEDRKITEIESIVNRIPPLPPGARFDQRLEIRGELGDFLRTERALQGLAEGRHERVSGHSQG